VPPISGLKLRGCREHGLQFDSRREADALRGGGAKEPLTTELSNEGIVDRLVVLDVQDYEWELSIRM